MSKSLNSLSKEINTSQKIKQYKAVSKGIANFDEKLLNNSLIKQLNFIAFNVSGNELTLLNDSFEGLEESDTIVIKNYQYINEFKDAKRFSEIRGSRIVKMIENLSRDESKYDINIDEASTVNKIIFNVTESQNEDEEIEEETQDENNN